MEKDTIVDENEQEKVNKYQNLARELAQRLWKMNTNIIPVVVDALGIIRKSPKKNPKRVAKTVSIKLLQKAALLGTARILRKVLDTG